jgi:ribonuclease BN (tRNA processing enzyme)
MRLTFIGTRGHVGPSTPRHSMNTSLLVSHKRRRVMIDAGESWLGKIDAVRPHAIVLTHAHPDHAFGLAKGAPCPVHATARTLELLSAYPLRETAAVEVGKLVEIEGLQFEAFDLQHSITAPAVAYRISDGKRTVFYCPDVVYIPEREKALAGVEIYIGDGATVNTSFVRRQKGELVGHTPVRTQLTWCKKSGVKRAIITHIGPEILKGDEDALLAQVLKAAEERGVEVEFAYDGMELLLR